MCRLWKMKLDRLHANIPVTSQIIYPQKSFRCLWDSPSKFNVAGKKKKIHSGKRVAAAGRRWNGGEEERIYNWASLPGAAVHTGVTFTTSLTCIKVGFGGWKRASGEWLNGAVCCVQQASRQLNEHCLIYMSAGSCVATTGFDGVQTWWWETEGRCTTSHSSEQFSVQSQQSRCLTSVHWYLKTSIVRYITLRTSQLAGVFVLIVCFYII